jgi:negative regulator of flagellin synthesis FlgM
MKINGPNQTNFNPYNNQIQKQMGLKKDTRQDQIEISNEAKKLLENDKADPKREAYVQDIKDKVDAGEYKINYEKTAQKMIDFWSRK